MAFGSSNYGSSSTIQDLAYYSRLRFDSKDHKFGLSFSFWRGSMKVIVTDRGVQNPREGEVVSTHISPFKARALAGCMNKVIKDENPSAYGVHTGTAESGVTAFVVVGKDVDGYFLYINKVNNNVNTDVKVKFVFDTSRNNVIKVADLESNNGTEIEDSTMNVLMFRDMLEDFARSASGASAYSVMDLARYEVNRINTFYNNIADKLGIRAFREVGNSSNSNYSNNNYHSNGGSGNGSFFGNKSNNDAPKRSNSPYAAISDLEDEL